MGLVRGARCLSRAIEVALDQGVQRRSCISRRRMYVSVSSREVTRPPRRPARSSMAVANGFKAQGRPSAGVLAGGRRCRVACSYA
jgi:hypothetical protein